MTRALRLWPLLTGTQRYEKVVSTRNRGHGEYIEAPILAYLIETPNGRILYDVGCDYKKVSTPRAAGRLLRSHAAACSIRRRCPNSSGSRTIWNASVLTPSDYRRGFSRPPALRPCRRLMQICRDVPYTCSDANSTPPRRGSTAACSRMSWRKRAAGSCRTDDYTGDARRAGNRNAGPYGRSHVIAHRAAERAAGRSLRRRRRPRRKPHRRRSPLDFAGRRTRLSPSRASGA